MLLKIQTMDDEGRGRALYEGRHYAIRGAFPGDEVEFREERLFKAHNLCVGRVKRYWRKGPHHVSRTCHHRIPCPACPLHGAKEELAFEVKRHRILEALRNSNLDFEVDPVVPHPESTGYRQKVKLMVHGEPGDLKLGVYVPYSHTFWEASQCPYVNTQINEAILKIMPVLNTARVEGLIAVILRASQKGVAGIFIVSKPLSSDLLDQIPLISVSERIQSESTNSLLAGESGQHRGPQQIKSLEDGQLVEPDSFCQTDPKQAKYLYELVADFLWQGPGHYVDAYAGVGGFSKSLLRKGSCQMTAVETNPACWDALKALGVQVNASLEGGILGLVLDPPKKGLMQEAQSYAQLKANRVALVSCDPDSMVRDLEVFLKQGYKVQRITPIDLFGGTPAIETVVFLKLQMSEG